MPSQIRAVMFEARCRFCAVRNLSSLWRSASSKSCRLPSFPGSTLTCRWIQHRALNGCRSTIVPSCATFCFNSWIVMHVLATWHCILLT
eukprot:3363265-Rhodomonas_salina.4